MEQLGYSNNSTYEIDDDVNCNCGKCHMIEIVRISPSGTLSSVYEATIPVKDQPVGSSFDDNSICRWCGSVDAILYKIIGNCVIRSNHTVCRCNKCQTVISRMFEYFWNPHPLLKKLLSKNDYLKTEVREQTLAVEHKKLRRYFLTEHIVLSDFLPKELCRLIFNIQSDITQKECGITLRDLFSANDLA